MFLPIVAMTAVIESLHNLLAQKKVFFFAGSGISFRSGLPSSTEVLRQTARFFLPQDASYRSFTDRVVRGNDAAAKSDILPEQFYEQIAQVTESDRAFSMWRCLDRTLLKQFNFVPIANITHRFVARQSAITGVPIFTLNFDDLFELGAHDLGITPLPVIPGTPEYREALELYHTGGKPPPNSVHIFKLHGTVSHLNTLHTTIRTISKINFETLDLISHLLQQRTVAMLGYSGRDVDYFPHLQLRSRKQSRQTFWMVGPQKDFASATSIERKTLENAKLMSATLVEMWPNEVFEKIAPELIRDDRQQQSDMKPVYDLLNDQLRHDIPLTPTQQLLILGLCLHAAGVNKLALQVMREVDKQFDSLSLDNQLLFLIRYARILDCCSLYNESRDASVRLILFCDRNRNTGIRHDRLTAARSIGRYQSLMARKQAAGPIISYGRDFLDYAPFPALAVLFIEYIFKTSSIGRKIRRLIGRRNFKWITDSRITSREPKEFSRALDDYFVVVLLFAWLDMKIMRYSFFERIADRCKRLNITALDRSLARSLQRHLKNIQLSAERVGDHFARAGALKYFDKSSDTENASRLSSYTMFSDYLNLALIHRHMGDDVLAAGDPKDAIEHFYKSYKMALRAGSSATALKALLGLVASGHVGAKQKLEKRARKFRQEISGAGYQTYLNSILEKV